MPVAELTGPIPMSSKRSIRSTFLIICANLCNLWLISEAENKFGCKITKITADFTDSAEKIENNLCNLR